MANYEKTLQWVGWTGYLSDLVASARVAVDTMSSWTDEEPRCTIQVGLKGLRASGLSLEGLETLAPYEIRSVESLTVRLGIMGNEGTRVSIYLKSVAPALAVIVEGDDRNKVEALAARLRDTLGRGGRRFAFSVGHSYPVFLIASAAIISLGSFVLNNGLHAYLWPRNSTRSGEAFVLVLYGVYLAAVFIVFWALPPLQLLAPGDSARWEKVRGWFVALVVAAVFAGLAAILVAKYGNLLLGALSSPVGIVSLTCSPYADPFTYFSRGLVSR